MRLKTALEFRGFFRETPAVHSDKRIYNNWRDYEDEKADVLKAVKRVDRKSDYVWDGKSQEDRQASAEELVAAVSAYGRKRGRPAGSGAKEQIALRVDRDVLARFRAEGPGWQTRMNEALKDWLRSHRRRPGA
jgi:uncharacterized protein (DUF4415 family)